MSDPMKSRGVPVRHWRYRVGRLAAVASVLNLALIGGGPARADGPNETNATDQEKRALLAASSVQAEAVTAYSEALMTWQSARRAQMYLAEASGKDPQPAPWVPADCRAMEDKLRAIEDRFFHIYMAHNGKINHNYHAKTRGRSLVMSEQAKRMASDPAARAEARRDFIDDCSKARDEAQRLLAAAHKHLKSLQDRAGDMEHLPKFKPTPRFVRKPRGTLKPDGKATGIIFGIPFGYAKRPALAPLEIDMVGGVFEKYDTDYKVSPVKIAADRGRSAQVIVPCARSSETYCESSWFQKHRNKPILRAGVPKDRPYRGQWMWALDQFHPLVRQMLEEYLTEVAKRYRGNPNVLTYTTAWEAIFGNSSGEWGKWCTGGRTPAANKAFRAYLRKKLGTIAELNAAWNADYESFDAIEPPVDVHHGPKKERIKLVTQLASGACPPLYYEYNRFLKDSFADYLAWCYQILKKANPTTPVSVSPSHGVMDGYLCTGRDSFLWAEKACDVWGSEIHSSIEEGSTYSIQRALGRETGIFEWIWNGYENWDNPSEDVTRAAARRNIWRLISWGRKILTFYGVADTYSGKAYNHILTLESDYHLLRIAAGIIGPMKHKLRSMEDAWLGGTVMEPQIVMLKSSTSQICAWPYEIVTTVSQDLHAILYGANYHYAFVPEEYILDGRDNLARYKVIVLPNVTHFPPGLTEKILRWVESGGTLIVGGIAGGFTPYGKRDGALMKAVFGDIEYAPWLLHGGVHGHSKWKIEVMELRPDVRDIGASPAEILLADYGKGQVLLAAKREDLRPGGAAIPAMRKLIDAAAPRMAWMEGDPFEMVLRRKGSRYYMVLINPSSQKPASGRVRLAKRFRAAIDRGIEGGFPIPLRDDGAGQEFDLSLAPGEGTMIELMLTNSKLQ